MEKNRKNLLLAIIFMIIYLIANIIFLKFNGGIISKNKIDNICNFIEIMIALSGIIYYFVLFKNKNINLNKHYKGILIWAIIFFIFNIISGIFGFIIYNGLNKQNKNVKRELPQIVLKDYSNKWLCLIGFIICLFLMFQPFELNEIFVILIYVVIFVIMFILFRKQLVHDFKIFKEYFKEYNSLVFKTWLKSILTLMILSLSIQLITNLNQATNQESINEMFTKTPILVMALTMIYAPIVEELMFRGVFRKFINNKFIFVIVSGVVFGALHVIDDFKSVSELLFILVYSSLGMYIANLYYKTNNLCTNIYFHFIQNSISVILMLITTLLK